MEKKSSRKLKRWVSHLPGTSFVVRKFGSNFNTPPQFTFKKYIFTGNTLSENKVSN